MFGDPDSVGLTRRLLDKLYTYNLDFARRILVGAKAEMDADLEETSYRWRAGRMEDLGFYNHEEAISVYQEIDPAQVKLGDAAVAAVGPRIDTETKSDALRIPRALVERLASGSPFARAVAGVTDTTELTNLQAHLVALSNRVLAADSVKPGEEAAVKGTLERVSATLDLAVEFLARGRAEDAVRAVRTVPLLRLFQTGISLIAKLSRLARAARAQQSGPAATGEDAATTTGLNLFDATDDAIISAFCRRRPMFPLLLDDPEKMGLRPISRLADLQVASTALERAAAGVDILRRAGLSASDLTRAGLSELGIVDAAIADAGLLGRSFVALAALSPPAQGALVQLEPLTREQRDQLRRLLQRPDSASALRDAALLAFFPSVAPAPSPNEAQWAAMD